MKRLLFVIIGLLILPSLARADLSTEAKGESLPDRQAGTLAKADDFTLSGYTEVGKRSTAEDYEEEDTDDDYTYQNYHLKLEQEVSDRLSYDLSSFIYKKDYKSRDSLDNISRLFKTNWSYYLKELKEEHFKLDFKLKYKEKRYKNTPNSEYDQIRLEPALSFAKKDLYIINLSAGIDNFDYLAPGAKDQLQIFSSLGQNRYFLGKKLMLTSAYKIETLEQKIINRKRTKQEVAGGFDYLFDLPWLYKITTRAGWGQRDTKEDEERKKR